MGLGSSVRGLGADLLVLVASEDMFVRVFGCGGPRTVRAEALFSLNNRELVRLG